MASSSKSTARKSTARTPVRSARGRTLAQELSEVLDVVRLHAASFPSRTERTRISLTLDSGSRLELEFSGPSDVGYSPETNEHVCLGYDVQLEAPGKSINDLDLGASAKAAAQNLLDQFPDHLKFTSGRRSIASQASAMAPNVVKNRKWIQQTYKDTPQRAGLQKWVDDHPAATTVSAIAAGLESVMNTWTQDQQRNFSRHISGDAFDVQPVGGDTGKKIKEAIGKLPKLHWHTFEEGGLEIWHAQFNP